MPLRPRRDKDLIGQGKAGEKPAFERIRGLTGHGAHRKEEA